MPTPRLSDEDARAAYDAWEAHGRRADLAAASLDMKPGKFDNRLSVAKTRGMHLSPGARHSVSSAQLVPGEARGGHRRVYDESGKQIDTVRWSVPQDAPTSEDVLSRIAAAFSDIPAAPAVAPPTNAAEDLCALFPLYDVHWGMHAWGAETGGQDYDLKLAESDLLGAFDRVLAVTPDCGHAVILIGGDFFHADDTRNETPAHHHKLDSDGRFFKTIDTAIRALDHIIRRVQAKASTVTVRVMRGNHDEHSHLPLTFALAERFRDSRVTVLKEPRDLFMFQWGRAGIFGHHGDKSTPTEFVLKLADVCPFWTESPHRKAYTGHRHKMAAQRIGGVAWEQLDAFCPPDAYGSTWTGRRSFKADVFSKQSGLFMSAYDPLERAA